MAKEPEKTATDETAAAKAALEATKSEGETPRPTGKNAEQDAELAELRAQTEAMTQNMAQMADQMAALMTVIASGKPAVAPVAAPMFPAPPLGITDPKAASAAVIAARSDTPKTYRALQAGTDLTQGFIPEGAVFTTTQPQGSWMEEVE